MTLETALELYSLICEGTQNISLRKESIKLRKYGFKNLLPGNIVKLAFDTRRIDQETEYNPRRGLQNYHRSEQFISEATSQKLINFSKLRKVLNELKVEFGKTHEWQDSYARVLLDTLNKGLRTEQKDGDFSENQPAMGSLDYIEELLYVRYRLHIDNLANLSEPELKKIILNKDEELVRKDINEVVDISRRDISEKSYDTLMEKLFGGVKADKNNKDCQRTITITIRDTVLDEK